MTWNFEVVVDDGSSSTYRQNLSKMKRICIYDMMFDRIVVCDGDDDMTSNLVLKKEKQLVCVCKSERERKRG